MSLINTKDNKFYAVVEYFNYRKNVDFSIKSIHLNVENAKRTAYNLCLNDYDVKVEGEEIVTKVENDLVNCRNKNIIVYTTSDGYDRTVYAVVELDANVFMN